MIDNDTYPLVPNRISNITPEFKTTIVKFEDGYEQRSSNWSEAKTEFTLTHQFMDRESHDTLVDFFKSKRGSCRKFYFKNHMDGKTYEVRFAEDKLAIEPANVNFFNATVKLVTVC